MNSEKYNIIWSTLIFGGSHIETKNDCNSHRSQQYWTK